MTPNELKVLQESFMSFILEQPNAQEMNVENIETHICQQGPVDTATRLAVYRNAYKLRLKEVIETDHEQLGFLLGDDLFDQMAEGYIKAHPSCYKSLRDYSNHLPDYLQDTPPFHDHPIIAELAYFERRLLNSFDAEEKSRFTTEELTQIPQHCWPSMQFRFHPSVQQFNCNWNTVETWQALKTEQAPPEAEKMHNTWLLWRNAERLTEFRSMDTQEAQLLTHALRGARAEALCEYLSEWFSEEDIANQFITLLVNWLNQGIIHTITYPTD